MRYSEIITENHINGIKIQRESYIDDYEEYGFYDEQEAADQFDSLVALFDNLPKQFNVYRGMCVSSKWLLQIKKGRILPLGTHWSYDVGGARTDLPGHEHSRYIGASDRRKLKTIIMIGKVDKEAVDWDTTFHKNMVYPDEAEIHLVNANIFLTDILDGGTTIKIGMDFPSGVIERPEFVINN